jgi:hypothetical protein
MPTVVFPYTKEGEANARKAAKAYDGRYVADKKAGKKDAKGVDVIIAVGPATKPKRRTRSNKKA